MSKLSLPLSSPENFGVSSQDIDKLVSAFWSLEVNPPGTTPENSQPGSSDPGHAAPPVWVP